MKEINLKDYLPQVKAPENFEEEVLKKIRKRKATKKRYFLISFRVFRPRLFIGLALLALLMAGFIFIPSFLKKHQELKTLFSLGPSPLERTELTRINLIEPVNFAKDFFDTPERKVIYILEAVNENFLSEVKY